MKKIILFLLFCLISLESAKSSEVSVCFTPGMDCKNQIIKTIENAKIEILVQAYDFSSLEIAEALIRADKRNIPVLVIIDRTRLNTKGSKYKFFLENGINVIVDTTAGLAHNKTMVIDRKLVITGSYNFSESAQKRNAENLVIIHDSQIAQKYITYWFNRILKIDKGTMIKK